MVNAADFVWENAETGYKEYKTTAYLKAYLEFMDSLASSGDRITYSNGKAEVRI